MACAARENVGPTGATPMEGYRARTVSTGPGAQPVSNAYSEVDAIRPTSPLLPADPTLVLLITEGMGACIPPGEGSLACHRASGAWVAGSRPARDEPGISVRGADPDGVDRLAVPDADLLRDRLADPDQPRFAMPTGLVEGLEHFVGQEQQYGCHVYRYT